MAYLIDPTRAEILRVPVETFAQMRETVRADLQIVNEWTTGDLLWVDEDGLSKLAPASGAASPGFFRLADQGPRLFIGRGLVTGRENPAGGYHRPWKTVQELVELVVWVSHEAAMAWVRANASDPVVTILAGDVETVIATRGDLWGVAPPRRGGA